MKTFMFSSEPPEHWDELCSKHGDLFNSRGWQNVLREGLGASALYGWDERDKVGVTVAVFKIGPFKVGYLGFPVGGTVGGVPVTNGIFEKLKSSSFPVKIHALRIPCSASDANADISLPSQNVPETEIFNLKDWCPDEKRKLKRDIKKARTSPLRVIEAVTTLHCQAIYGLYKKTVARHKGKLRYSEEYFSALIALADKGTRLRCFLAMKEDKIAGFAVVICHGDRAFYLHAGIDLSFKHYSPSDLLLYEAILWAKACGMNSFNMMPSPPVQPLLVRYKEKWGGVTREQKTYQLVLTPFQGRLYNSIENVYRTLRALG